MKRILSSVLVYIGLFLLACSSSSNHLKIACASSLEAPMKELGAKFTEETGVEIEISTGASGVLYNQIMNGAPFNIFASADESYISALEDNGKVSESYQYANARLAYVTRGEDDISDIKEYLLRSDINLVVADPRTAPIGKAAEYWLKKEGLWESIKNDLLIAGDVGKANAMFSAGNGDVLLTSNSIKSILSKEYTVHLLDMSPEYVIYHSLCILDDSADSEDAIEFMKFMKSEQAKEILKTYDYIVL